MQKIKLSGIKAIGFDVDGTLYHSPPEMASAIGQGIIKSIAGLLRRDEDELAEEYLARRDEYKSNTMAISSFGLSGEEVVQKLWDELDIEKYVKRDTRLIKMIERLGKKYRLFLLSNGSGRQIKRKLKYLGLSEQDFDPRVYCYDMGWVKPEPAPFLYALEKLEMRPEEVVYVGDRTDVDVEAANSVGLKTILVYGEYKGATASCETVYDVELMLE